MFGPLVSSDFRGQNGGLPTYWTRELRWSMGNSELAPFIGNRELYGEGRSRALKSREAQMKRTAAMLSSVFP